MNKRERRPVRSDSYQWMLLEVSCSDEVLTSFTNEQSLAHRLNPYQYDERIDELEDELKKLFWSVADSVMTPRQKTILHMRADGYTQMEIADILGVNQSSGWRP